MGILRKLYCFPCFLSFRVTVCTISTHFSCISQLMFSWVVLFVFSIMCTGLFSVCLTHCLLCVCPLSLFHTSSYTERQITDQETKSVSDFIQTTKKQFICPRTKRSVILRLISRNQNINGRRIRESSIRVYTETEVHKVSTACIRKQGGN